MLTRTLLVLAVVGLLSPWLDGMVYPEVQPDRGRAGQIPEDGQLEAARGQVPALVTEDAAALGLEQLTALGRLFGARPAGIHRFRWGPSMAPAGHPLAGTTWYTIWRASDVGPGEVVSVLRLAVDGRILEQLDLDR
ncbi:MAG: hypothetical protein WDA75_20770 [Candidatus Latescibacterota bacterium]|jgi:hypothetical protein